AASGTLAARPRSAGGSRTDARPAPCPDYRPFAGGAEAAYDRAILRNQPGDETHVAIHVGRLSPALLVYGAGRALSRGGADLSARALAQPRLVHRGVPRRRPAGLLVPRVGRAAG